MAGDDGFSGGALRLRFERKERDARPARPAYRGRMSIDPDQAWAAFERRDRSFDGRFVGAVSTTGIYCKPSCPARRPRRENVAFYADGDAAAAAGFRACLRCRPDEVARDRQAVAQAVTLLGGDDPPQLGALAAAVGYAPHHFHRLFKRETGVTPAAYLRAQRAARLEQLLGRGKGVTEAIYEAGFDSASSGYAVAAARLGMVPSAWKRGGAGVTIRWTLADTIVGEMLLAATDKGICRLAFDEDEAALRKRFPRATLIRDDLSLRALVDGAVAACENPRDASDLPLDIGGTAFQQRVWDALRAIPAGETRSYRDIAVALGLPGGSRAVGQANGANAVAVLIPCHRVIAAGGKLGGYAHGLDRKRELLRREREPR